LHGFGGRLLFHPMVHPLPAIVAAAGLSSRMGTSKPLLDAGGHTFLARILTSLRGGGADPLIVVVRDVEGRVGREARTGGALVIRNPDPTSGPISSLQAGIRAVPSDSPAVLFCPVDHPLFLPETVLALLSAFAREAAPIVAPTYEGRRGHPVVFHRDLFPELLEDGLPNGARSVIQRYLSRRIEIPVNDPGILIDVDTPTDYRHHFSRLDGHV
jgi:molybdenum cofactor cytidylyltransferase